MVDVPRDRFVRYRELTEVLDALVAERPDLIELSEIGRSHEDRPIVLATVTNRATGPHHEKPAFWIDANIHATEHAGGTAALHLLHKLVTEYGTDADVTKVLDTRCFYIVPRLNPDGAELALQERPTYVRSSSRPWPRTDQQDGLIEEDMDGDGRILQMRLRAGRPATYGLMQRTAFQRTLIGSQVSILTPASAISFRRLRSVLNPRR